MLERLRGLRVRPFELFSYGVALATLWFLRSQGLQYGWNTIRYYSRDFGSGLVRVTLIGILLQLVAHAVIERQVRPFLREVASWRWLTLTLRLWFVFFAFAYTYTWLKVSVPLVRTRLFDVELWQLDRWLHFGVSPTVLAIELVGNSPVARWVDEYYALWLPSIPLIMAYVMVSPGRARRRNFALANAVLWLVGAWIYLAVPALGPCYSSPDVMEPTRDWMPKVVSTQELLWNNYLVLVRSRGSMLESFSPLFGVAAMPSLHVGAYAMYTLWARRYARRWYPVGVIATALIFFGSIATGWHYAVDSYVGLALGWLAVVCADRFEPVPEPTPTEDPPSDSAQDRSDEQRVTEEAT